MGLAGTADTRDLQARDYPAARLAIDVYILSLRASIAVNSTRNEEGRPDCEISADGPHARALVIAAREDLEIRWQVRALLEG